MENSLKLIMRHIGKLKDNELGKVREFVSEESLRRDLQREQPRAYTRLYNLLKYIFCHWESWKMDYEECLKGLSEMTEEEFLKYRGAGKSVLAAAKQELAKRSLSFKPKGEGE